MTTVFVPFTLDQGETWSRTTTWTTGDTANGIPVTPVDLTGASAVLSVRQTPSVLATALLTVTPTLGGMLGTLAYGLTATQTDSLATGRYFYDLLVTFSTGPTVYKLQAGTFDLR